LRKPDGRRGQRERACGASAANRSGRDGRRATGDEGNRGAPGPRGQEGKGRASLSPLYHCCSSFLSKCVDFCSSASCSPESLDCLRDAERSARLSSDGVKAATVVLLAADALRGASQPGVACARRPIGGGPPHARHAPAAPQEPTKGTRHAASTHDLPISSQSSQAGCASCGCWTEVWGSSLVSRSTGGRQIRARDGKGGLRGD